MGIKNLRSVLKRHAPNSLGITKPLSEYIGKTIAVDASVYMYKYKSIYGTQWLSAFHNFIKSLDGIKCVFVFDSKECVKEKMVERAKRNSKKKDLRDKVRQIEEALVEYTESGTVADILKTFVHENSNYRRLLVDPGTVSQDQVLFSETKAREFLSRSENQLMSITPTDFSTVKEMCSSMGCATIDAEIEAEFLCAILCHENKVYAAMTEDSDAYAYMTPRFLCKVGGGKCTEVRAPDVIAELNMTKHQFVDLCILCGTDYNDSVRGIGPVKAFKSIKQYGSIKDAAESLTTYNFSKIDIDRVRSLFEIRSSGVDEIVFPEVDSDSLSSIMRRCNIHEKYKKPRRLLN